MSTSVKSFRVSRHHPPFISSPSIHIAQYGIDLTPPLLHRDSGTLLFGGITPTAIFAAQFETSVFPIVNGCFQ